MLNSKVKKEVKELLLGETMCGIQHNGWPCNTCFHSMDLGISNDKLHELWKSVLLIRGDYNNTDPNSNSYIPQTDKEVKANIKELIILLK